MKRKTARNTKTAPVRKNSNKKTARTVRARPKRIAAARAKATPADALDALVTASAQALGLPADPAWHGGVRFNLGLILKLGALVDEFPLPDEIEPGPVFHA